MRWCIAWCSTASARWRSNSLAGPASSASTRGVRCFSRPAQSARRICCSYRVSAGPRCCRRRLSRCGMRCPASAGISRTTWTISGVGCGAPAGQPATPVPADQHFNRKVAPSPLTTMLRSSAKLATRSPWRISAAGVRGQAGSARVGTRHSHAIPPLGRRLHRPVGHCGPWRHPAHRGRWRHRAACLKSGQFCLVQLIGRIISLHIREAAGVVRRLALSHMARMAVARRRRRRCVGGRRRRGRRIRHNRRDAFPRCPPPSRGHLA
jgi:hypothetical protein